MNYRQRIEAGKHPDIHIPRWKYYLSFLWEQHIESAPSTINPHLYVSLKQGRFQLSTANAIYSFEDKYDNFYKAFSKIKLDKLSGEKVLLLGFGLGSIPYMLNHHFSKLYDFVGVDIDESVVYLASKYGIPKIESRVELVVADANQFIQSNTQQFDLIIIDVFLDDMIPSDIQKTSFLEKSRALLKDNGLILYNRLSLTEKDKEASTLYFESIFKDVFEQAEYVDVKGNWILVSDKEYLIID